MREQIGYVAVDAGLMSVGDPCYHSRNRCPYNDWQEFTKNLADVTQVPFEDGGPGRAIVIGGFGGDGVYPVFVTRDENGRITQLIVQF